MGDVWRERLNVIALVSGGKDSFFSLLHCRANGHRVVALANLHPALPPSNTTADPGSCSHSQSSSSTAAPAPAVSAAGPAKPLQETSGAPGSSRGQDEEDEQDLNSFMYQTVGHQVIPLYAEATGIPLYRQAIIGSSGQHGKDYSPHAHGTSHGSGSGPADDPDETESMIPLLRAVMAAHPEANAICAGAILSTYQRTRVESVATRLGLVPVAYLWKFPVLPAPSWSPPGVAGDVQLLDDMAAVGLEVRIIKVASGGLDDSFLWTNLASASGKHRVFNAMRRFGAQKTGAVIGEGGEFETLVLDGPPSFFRKRIVVAEEDQRIIREGGGSAWLMLRNARLEDKNVEGVEDIAAPNVRIPDLLDVKFSHVLGDVDGELVSAEEPVFSQVGFTGPKSSNAEGTLRLGRLQDSGQANLRQWCFIRDPTSSPTSIEAETKSIVERIRQKLHQEPLTPSAIIDATVLLRPTVSCGDLLSPDPSINIAIYLSVHHSLQPDQRQGLHVQSRSYWAPANIGPYSQAITIPATSLASSNTEGGPKLVSIAGQIPLVPATMALPREGGLPLQLTLSLQHLWRIGLEMGVQWWSSAVAYFPRSTASDTETMFRKALLASKAWETAHLWGAKGDEDSDGDDDEAGPDLWDRRFNPQYQTFGASEGVAEEAKLPDWDVLAVPPLFAAEVAELPRAAGVEWHAHVGLSGVRAKSVSSWNVVSTTNAEVDVYHCVVRSGNGVSFVQTVVAERLVATGDGEKKRLGVGEIDGIAWVAVAKLQDGGAGAEVGGLVVAARYVDVAVEDAVGNGVEYGEVVVPCASLWDARGRALASVTVYQSVFEDVAGLGWNQHQRMVMGRN
ncbi:hypothetical protein B0T16DRAFT_424780 [Cercophora newfieldiana]|uniref:Diphthine--ammonia ligase n=1 Tax=Cercophora newfieldiana TaxID=92897 RepID=A0AA40CYC3_9PEZI|nr:hypothetical protein B0T16DRAFT_424780 [Cercophora newfieldiana]